MRFRNTTFAILGALASLSFAAGAKAAPFSGDFGYLPGLGSAGPGGTADFTDSSLTMNPYDTVSFVDGTFTGYSLDTVTFNTTPITGLSASQTPVNVPDFMTFFSPSELTNTGGNGNAYIFNLTSLSETTPSGFGNFLGYGTLVDTSGVLDPTPAEITIGFTQTGNNYTGTLTTSVPEPTTFGLAAIGLVGALARRRRKV